MAQSAPNLAQDLVRIHRVITRAINIDFNKGIEYLQSGFPTTETLHGYTSYTHCLAAVLGSHHTSEDIIAFPEFKKVLPSAPYARLTAEHEEVELLLASIRQALADISGNSPQGGLKTLVNTLQKISRVWGPHIHTEERHFSKEALEAAFSPEEEQKISEAASKHSQEHSEPPYWVVPFILYNLEQEDRAIMAANFPPMIMDELVPKVWKDQWAPMKPFLLD
jgi:hemerythrin-like domain-containing protein